MHPSEQTRCQPHPLANPPGRRPGSAASGYFNGALSSFCALHKNGAGQAGNRDVVSKAEENRAADP
jgi:hypothetical protein